MIIIAYFMLYLPMAQTTLRASLEQLSDQIESRTKSWAKPFLYFSHLDATSHITRCGRRICFGFLNLMKELTATLLLTSNDIKTLSIAVWEHTSDAQYAAATPYALMLVLFRVFLYFY